VLRFWWRNPKASQTIGKRNEWRHNGKSLIWSRPTSASTAWQPRHDTWKSELDDFHQVVVTNLDLKTWPVDREKQKNCDQRSVSNKFDKRFFIFRFEIKFWNVPLSS
jgi:hypothetical protein